MLKKCDYVYDYVMVLKTPTKDSCEIGEELSGKFDQPPTNCLWIRHRYNCIS